MTVRTRPDEEHLAYAPERFDDSPATPADPWVEAGGDAREDDSE